MNYKNNELLSKTIVYFFTTIFLQLTAFRTAFSPLSNLFCCKNFVLNTYLYISIMLSVTLFITSLINYLVIQPIKDGDDKKKKYFNLLFNPYLSLVLFIILIAMVSFKFLYTPPITTGLTLGKHIWMYGFAILFGLTLSTIYAIYSSESIDNVMMLTLGATLAVTLLVYIKPEIIFILKLSNILYGGLLALIGLIIINLFIGSYKLFNLISLIGVVIFIGLLMYDSKIIMMASNLCMDFDKSNVDKTLLDTRILNNYKRLGNFKQVMNELKLKTYTRPDYIHYAVSIYLDILNLFLYSLRLLGEHQ